MALRRVYVRHAYVFLIRQTFAAYFLQFCMIRSRFCFANFHATFPLACYFRATHRRTTSDISLSPGFAENNRDEAGGQLKERERLFALVDRVRLLFLFPSFLPFFSPRFVSRRRDIELLRAAIPDALRPQRLKGAGYDAPYTT